MEQPSGRPARGEAHPYYFQFIDSVTDEDVVDALRRQVDEMRAFTDAVPDAKESFRYAEGKWSVREVVGHLLDAERVFGYRAHCISRGEAVALPGFDEQEYVARSSYDDEPLSGLAEEFATVRRSNLNVFERVARQPGGWERIGNANGSDISVRAIAFVLLGHVRHHLRVITDRYGPFD